MSRYSHIYRKIARGEATPAELDLIDKLEGVIVQPEISVENSELVRTEILFEDVPVVAEDTQPSPPEEERCIPCEAHQKKRRSDVSSRNS